MEEREAGTGKVNVCSKKQMNATHSSDVETLKDLKLLPLGF